MASHHVMRAPQTQMEPPEQFLGTSYRNVWEREALLLLGMQRMGDEAGGAHWLLSDSHEVRC